MRIKICGITTLDDALLAAGLGADALGFIFYRNSKRYIEPNAALGIIQNLPPFISTVGVFVNEEESIVNKVSENLGLSFVQLHGDESPEYFERIESKKIKAFRIGDHFDDSVLKGYESDYFLFDSFSSYEFGGTGNAFDWNTIPAYTMRKSILAGGVSADNIEQIVREIKPAAIDISSKLEIEPGKKDHQKMKEFFKIYYRTINQ